jgi:hypothetical protein
MAWSEVQRQEHRRATRERSPVDIDLPRAESEDSLGEAEPAPKPSKETEPDAHAPRPDPPAQAKRTRGDPSGGTVDIEAVLTDEEYKELLTAAAEAQMTPNDFLRQAVKDARFYQRNAPPGSRILIESGGKVRTVK